MSPDIPLIVAAIRCQAHFPRMFDYGKFRSRLSSERLRLLADAVFQGEKNEYKHLVTPLRRLALGKST